MNPQFLIITLVIIPVLSVCLGFTVHYAIRPLVEMLLDAIHDLGRIAAGSSSDRVARLEIEVDELRSEVKLLRAGAGPDHALEAQALPEPVEASSGR